MKECDLKSLLRNFQSIQIQVQYLKENNKECKVRGDLGGKVKNE